MLLEIGIDITAGARVTKNPTPTNIEPNWRSVLNVIRILNLDFDRQNSMEWFDAMLQPYGKRKGFLRVRRWITIPELFVQWIQIGDIDPLQCLRTAPHYDIRHTLSYVVQPLTPSETFPPMTPTWRFLNPSATSHQSTWDKTLPRGNTVMFNSSCFDQSIFQEALSEFPFWMIQCFNGSTTLHKSDLIHLIANDNRFFDHVPVPVRGDNQFYNIEIITQSKTKKGPRRLYLFDKMHEPCYQPWYSSSLQDGYTYGLSRIPKMFFPGRSLQEYPGIAKLKVEMWKRVHHHLSPISKICPPNSVQGLLYMDDFKGRINPHRDMSPGMNVDPAENSQVIGSSVIVVSFFDPQILQFEDLNTKLLADSVFTEHCSVYVLDPNDDLFYKHSAQFVADRHTKARKHKTRIRYALTMRWLSNRKKFHCTDNNRGLSHFQAVPFPKKTIRKPFTGSLSSRQTWCDTIDKIRKDHQRKKGNSHHN